MTQFLESQLLPQLKQQVSREIQLQKATTQTNTRGFLNRIWKRLIKLKKHFQEVLAFCFTLVFLIPIWIGKVIFSFLDSIQKGTRLFIWGWIKCVVLFLNFAYRISTMFGLVKAVAWLEETAKKYFHKYVIVRSNSSLSEIHEQEKEKKPTEKKSQLIDVQKIGQRIKTPNIFLSHQAQVNQQNQQKGVQFEVPSSNLAEFRQDVNYDLVPQRQVAGNIVQLSNQLNTPKIFENDKHKGLSHLKRTNTEPNFLIGMKKNQNHKSHQSLRNRSSRHSPEKDISQTPELNKVAFKKKTIGSPQHDILMTPHKRGDSGSNQMEEDLGTLKQKMAQLIEQNNREIQELEEWLREKSRTVSLARKENVELLQQIEKLKDQNAEKTKLFSVLEERVKELQERLQQQEGEKKIMTDEVERLQEEVKVKTIEIMSLKEKISTNLQHIQLMSTIMGDRSQESQFSKQEKLLSFPKKETPDNSPCEPHRSLRKDLERPEEFNQILQLSGEDRSDFSPNLDEETEAGTQQKAQNQSDLNQLHNKSTGLQQGINQQKTQLDKGPNIHEEKGQKDQGSLYKTKTKQIQNQKKRKNKKKKPKTAPKTAQKTKLEQNQEDSEPLEVKSPSFNQRHAEVEQQHDQKRRYEVGRHK